MALIQCTKKLLDELPQARVISEKPTLLGDWHANIFRIDRRKCILFMNDKTLFSLFVPGLKKNDFQHITHLFMENLALTLKDEGLSSCIKQIEDEYENNLTFTKTSSRRVLGVMSNFIRLIDFIVYRSANLKYLDPLDMNQKINRIPLASKSAYYPVEALTQLLNMQGLLKL